MSGARRKSAPLARTHRRLAALTALLSGAVLAASLAAGYALSCRQLREAGEAAFAARCTELYRQIASGVLDDPWLARWEVENRCVATLRDNGTQPFFPGGWQPETPRSVLLDRAWQAVQADPGLMGDGAEDATRSFPVSGDGRDAYRACAASIPLGRSACQVVVVQDIAREQQDIRAAGFSFLGYFAAGLLCLGAVSWAVTGLALRPVRRAMERQAQFVSAAGHELRTPLAAIGASLDAMERCPAQAEEYREAARAEAGRMGRLVEDLLTLSAADAARWTWKPVLLDTDAVLIDAAEQLRGLCRQRGFPLELDLPRQILPAVRGDADRLVQLIAALVDNATSYAPTGTTVTLQGRAENGAVCIRVIDHGPGVPDGEKARIFRRFARGDQSRAPSGHFGLGLAVARELAALHGGQLTCTDTPGGGATFALVLPAARRAGADGRPV